MNKLGKILLVWGLCVLVTGMGVRLLLGEWESSSYAICAIGGLFIGLAIVADFKFYKELMSMKTTKNGLSLGIVVVLVSILFVAINYISHVRNIKWDLTANRLNSLSDQTINLLKSVPEEIAFRGFFHPGANEQEDMMSKVFQDLVKMYQAENSRVKLFTYDPFKRKDLVEKYKVMTTGEIIVNIGDKQTTVNDISEQAFTNAIIKLTRNTKSIYSIVGHGERELEESGPSGLGQLKRYLEEEGYKVSPLRLVTAEKVPTDAAALMIIKPSESFGENELKLLREYLLRGGKLFLAMDPGTNSNIVGLSNELGIEFQNQYLQDYYGRLVMKSSNFVVGLQYSGTHEVTSKIKKVQTIFPLASAVRRAPKAPSEIFTDDLVMTEQSAILVKKINEEAVESKSEAKQQFTVAMAAKGKFKSSATQEFSAVVVGDSDFVSNETIDVLGANRDLALNIIASLSNDSEMISIRPKSSQGSPMVLTTAQNGGLVALLALLPLTMFGTSLVIWWRRRGA